MASMATMWSIHTVPLNETESPVTRRPLSAEAKANIPPQFQLTNTVDTSVNITEAPAVTHEVVERQHTEVIHEVITRDIHVDHFHTSIQPLQGDHRQACNTLHDQRERGEGQVRGYTRLLGTAPWLRANCGPKQAFT